MHKPITLVLLGFISLLSACSMTSLLYDTAPWYVRERIDDYFDLTSAQTRQLDRNIESVFAWHRRDELPQYAEFLERTSTQFADGLTRDELTSLLTEMGDARRRLAIQTIPTASTFLLTVSDEQLDYYKEAVQEKIDERREFLALPKDERDEQDFDDLLESLEDWFGDFDDTQLTQLRTISDELPDNREYWLQQREKRTHNLVEFLRADPSRDDIDKYLHEWFVDWRYENENQRQISQRANKNRQSAMLRIDALLTTEQREHAIERLNGYRQDFLVLSTQTEDSSPSGSRHR